MSAACPEKRIVNSSEDILSNATIKIKPEEATLDNAEEFIQQYFRHNIDYYNYKSTEFITNLITNDELKTGYFGRVMHSNAIDHHSLLKYGCWQFGADKAGLNSGITIANFCEEFDIDLVQCLIDNINYIKELQEKVEKKYDQFPNYTWTSSSDYNTYDAIKSLRDKEKMMTQEMTNLCNTSKSYTLHNRAKTIVFSLYYRDSLTTGYFHYFNVIGIPNEVKKAFIYLKKNINHSAVSWGGPH